MLTKLVSKDGEFLLCIDDSYVKELGLNECSEINISVVGDSIVITPLTTDFKK